MADGIRERRDADDPGAPAVVRAELWCAMAEAFLTVGRTQDAAECAERGAASAEAAEDEPARFRAAALSCVTTALGGDYDAADHWRETAEGIAASRSWGMPRAGYPLLLGRILLASAQLRADRLSEIATLLRSRPDEPVWASTATTVEAMTALVAGDAGAAFAKASVVVAMGDTAGVQPMVRGFAIGLLADALLVRGEPERVLAVLEGVASPAGHALCYDMQRSAAHLMNGNPLAALRVTSGCVAMGTRHNRRTLAPILLRRAVAHRAIGDDELADIELEDAFRIVAASGSATLLLTLSTAELTALLDRLEARPDLRDTVAGVRARLEQLPRRAAPLLPALPALMPREHELAWAILGDQTVADLARMAFVTVNTVKTQLRGLYRKLGVGSRAAAVEHLQRSGFYDRPQAGAYGG